jgi:class 3 adenylate cyclase
VRSARPSWLWTGRASSARVRLMADEGFGVDERPVTRYAKAPDGVSLAYQVTGEGSADLVFPRIFTIPIDLFWDEPSFVRFAKRLGGFSRTVWYDPRGMGASGGNLQDSSVEEITDADLTAVLDAAGCERVVLVGTDLSGATVIRYAATHPERVSALILINAYAHYIQHHDYPWGVTADALDQVTAYATEVWGSGAVLERLAPSKSGDGDFRAWWARCERLGLGVDAVVETTWQCFVRDMRALLPTLAVLTLVVHREGNPHIHVGAGRYLAEHIPDAKYVELTGDDHLFWVGDTDALLDEVEEFLTGSRQAPEGDVITATILFTDIVASTEQSARLGHRKWAALIDAHDTMVRSILARYRGREIKTIGDGFLATFDATTRAVRAARDIVASANGLGLEVRAGVHTGEVEVRSDDVVGLAVTIAKRICDLAVPGEVFLSEVVNGQLVGSDIETSDRGTHVLKGVPREWRLFAVEG